MPINTISNSSTRMEIKEVVVKKCISQHTIVAIFIVQMINSLEVSVDNFATTPLLFTTLMSK